MSVLTPPESLNDNVATLRAWRPEDRDVVIAALARAERALAQQAAGLREHRPRLGWKRGKARVLRR